MVTQNGHVCHNCAKFPIDPTTVTARTIATTVPTFVFVLLLSLSSHPVSLAPVPIALPNFYCQTSRVMVAVMSGIMLATEKIMLCKPHVPSPRTHARCLLNNGLSSAPLCSGTQCFCLHSLLCACYDSMIAKMSMMVGAHSCD